MRKVLFFTLACLAAGGSIAQEKKQETLEGNGKIVTREVPVTSFDALKANGIYELRLSQGDRESVKIEADENLQSYFQVRNEGSKLVIDMEKLKNKSLKSKGKMKVYVTFKKLKEMELGTVGSVSSETALRFEELQLKNRSVGHLNLELTANKLELDNHGVGSVVLSGKAENVVVKNRGVGSLEAGKFVVENMEIENSGVGSAEVNAEKNLKVTDSFLGKVTNKGAAQLRRMNKVRV